MTTDTDTAPRQRFLDLNVIPVAAVGGEENRLVKMLYAIGDWASARVLCEMLGLPQSEGGRRQIRLWAEASRGMVVAGQLGYKHTLLCDSEEIRSIGWMKSQAESMMDRYNKTMRVWHSGRALAQRNQ